MDNLNRGNEPLHKKVIEWLTNEGYPLEFYTASILEKHRYEVRQGFYVRDTQSNLPREIDVLASVTTMMDQSFSFLRVIHLIECKWSKDKPWIIFTSKNSMISPAACITQTMGSEAGRAALWALAGNKELQSLDAFVTPVNPGYNGRQAFTKGNDVFFGAMQSVTSAALSLAKYYDNGEKAANGAPDAAVVIFPIIVVDGQLYEVTFDADSNQLVVNEVDRIRIHWKGAELWKPHATIDLVSASRLDTFASQRMKEMPILIRHMRKTFGEIYKCFDERSLEPLTITSGSRGIRGLPSLLARVDAMEPIKKADAAKVEDEDHQVMPSDDPDIKS